MNLKVNSEIGLLKQVLVHRPQKSIEHMMPELMDELLFDDILDSETARQEHDMFTKVLRTTANVFDVYDLLFDVLKDDTNRQEILDVLPLTLTNEHTLENVMERLNGMDSNLLAHALIDGICENNKILMPPAPNLLFMRDPGVVINDMFMVSTMARPARNREPLLMSLIARHHPLFNRPVILQENFLSLTQNPRIHYPTIEGGDVLVMREDIVAIGCSERTSLDAVLLLGKRMMEVNSSVRHLIAVMMPRQRSSMHLDTIFTQISHTEALGYKPFFDPKSPQCLPVLHIDLKSGGMMPYEHKNDLIQTLNDLGMALEILPCGGDNPIDQSREQWTDGANAVALKPGHILIYERNRKTAEVLQKAGYFVCTSNEYVNFHDTNSLPEKAVVMIEGKELSRARGGGRCMTMPIMRESCG